MSISTWTTKTGTVLEIYKMPTPHLENIRQMLRAKGARTFDDLTPEDFDDTYGRGTVTDQDLTAIEEELGRRGQ